MEDHSAYKLDLGGVVERLIAPVLKTGEVLKPSWVRIPPPPPAYGVSQNECCGMRMTGSTAMPRSVSSEREKFTHLWRFILPTGHPTSLATAGQSDRP